MEKSSATTGVTDNGTSVVYLIPSGDPKRFTCLKVTISWKWSIPSRKRPVTGQGHGARVSD